MVAAPSAGKEGFKQAQQVSSTPAGMSSGVSMAVASALVIRHIVVDVYTPNLIVKSIARGASISLGPVAVVKAWKADRGTGLLQI